VHWQLGPGLPERNYQTASAIEFKYQGIAFVREPCLPVYNRGIKIGQYRPDFIVEG
jgi:GxxExxY protein